LSTQRPVTLTCVTTGKPKEYRTLEFAITFRTISKRLFGGFVEKQTRYSKYRIAEPEKALLDWIYLCLQTGVTPSLDEIDFNPVDKQKLVKYAGQYPGTVRKCSRTHRPLNILQLGPLLVYKVGLPGTAQQIINRSLGSFCIRSAKVRRDRFVPRSALARYPP
jgi:hypothetical protein